MYVVLIGSLYLSRINIFFKNGLTVSTYMFELGFYYVRSDNLKILDSSDPSASAPRKL